jgi:hypothetical protein
MKKINILIRGGLGNQLFIYAALKTIINLNKSYIPYYYYFNSLNPCKNTYFDLSKILQMKKINLFLCIEKIYIYLNFFFFKNIINDSCNHKKLKNLLTYKSISMFGYFQKLYWYKSSYKNVIDELISFLRIYFKDVRVYNVVLSTNYYPESNKRAIGLNFDYYLNGLKKLKIKNNNNILIIGYDKNNYITELKLFLKKRGYKNVISYDKIKKTTLDLKNTYDKSIFDYLVIARSKNLIMSNSTFCWWAALTRQYFSMNSSKVISPKKYTKNKFNNFDNPGNPGLDWTYLNNSFF